MTSEMASPPGEAPLQPLPKQPFPSDKSPPIKEEPQPHQPDDTSRGRRRSREHGSEDLDEDVKMAQSEDGAGAGPPSRKRRRSRKGLGQKFVCGTDGCVKSYSRAEHLYRHRLNHNPTEVYECEVADCDRKFVRKDLCVRHMERHTAKGSQLQRKDVFLHDVQPNSAGRPSLKTVQVANQLTGPVPSSAHNIREPARHTSDSPNPRSLYTSSPETMVNTLSPTSATTNSTLIGSVASGGVNPASFPPRLTSSVSDGNLRSSHPGMARSDSSTTLQAEGEARGYSQTPTVRSSTIATVSDHGQRHASFGSSDAPFYQDGARPHQQRYLSSAQMPAGASSSMSDQATTLQYPSIKSGAPAYGSSGVGLSRAPIVPTYINASGSFTPQQDLAPFSLPPPEYASLAQASFSGTSTMNNPSSSVYSSAFVDPGATSNGALGQTDLTDPGTFDRMNTPMTIPVFGEAAFGEESYNRSPNFMSDTFTYWLFGEQQMMLGGRTAPAGAMNAFADAYQPTPQGGDLLLNGLYNQPMPPQHPMAVTSLLDTSPSSVLSDHKRQQLMEIIVEHWNETDHAGVHKRKEALLEGDRDHESHPLSLRMMQTYITSYWYHFQPQLPILHKPTFAADETPNLLLMAIMVVGASCLGKAETAQAAAELAKFMAWHLRWEIFSDADFRPPAKLWIFQALLLLETYEKMYSSRALHERAHIHHYATITLMRRGSSLTGRSPLDSPPSVRDEKSGAPGSESGANTPERWWNHWITSEATRRAAFAAFVLDSTHATMFGHSAFMFAHEMRVPLPCDESLWSATSSAEVGRIEASLHAQGIKRTTFQEGLKATLNKQAVRTNSFGRTILMAGLLSVSWHMNQRDLQVHSLGVHQALGGRDKWRLSLTQAFDRWRDDFDTSLSEGQQHTPGPYYPPQPVEDSIFESRTVLHHLAHMALHVDIVDCQIYARAGRLLGRSIGPQDYRSAQRRMNEWAKKARARDATWYSLRFLCEVLLPYRPGWQSTTNGGPGLMWSGYAAEDDCLLNRPWVLYFAALIVWSYGYALEGPIPAAAAPDLKTEAQQQQDMVRFLQRVGPVPGPESLIDVHGRNHCAGLLLVLRDIFRKTRWELLHEAANLLTNCVDMLLPANNS
ncbi:MAG: hypothetical protein M1817_006282 [Caeruleum heppii]|nr:MAG: hypothetical protein M1817_006282 [Caeruleum heppii]